MERGINIRSRLNVISVVLVMLVVLVMQAITSCVSISYAPELTKYDDKERGSYIIQQAFLFDGTQVTSPLPVRSLLIESGKVTHISEKPIHHPNAKVVDGRGKTVMPGFVDLHIHFAGSASALWKPMIERKKRIASAYVYAGVTTVLDLGGPHRPIQRLKKSVTSGSVSGPSIYYAGKTITSPKGYPMTFMEEFIPGWVKPLSGVIERTLFNVANTPEQGRKHVAQLKKQGATVVKVMLDDTMGASIHKAETIRAIVSEAERLKMPVIAHISEEQYLALAFENGIRIFSHVPFGSTLNHTLVEKLAAEKALFLTVFRLADHIAHGQKGIELDAFEKSMIDPKMIDPLEEGATGLSMLAKKEINNIVEHQQAKFENARKLHAAGVQLVPASDGPFLGSVAGASFHSELRLFQTALDLTPLETLTHATALPGALIDRWSGEARGTGRLFEGGVADLVVVGGNIEEDIKLTTKIEHVFVGGRRVQRCCAAKLGDG